MNESTEISPSRFNKVKTCKGCGETKMCPGTGRWCRSCYNKKHRERMARDPEKSRLRCKEGYRKFRAERLQSVKVRYGLKKESILEQQKERRLANLDLFKAKDATSYKKRRKSILAKKRLYHIANRERRSAYMREWIKTPAGRAASAANHARRKMQMDSSPNRVTAKQLNHLRRTMTSCFYCGRPDLLCFDHFRPLVKGGHHSIDNIVIACIPCNAAKHAKSPEEWYEEIGKPMPSPPFSPSPAPPSPVPR